MKRVLIIGSNGMAGHMIFRYLNKYSDFDVFDIARANSDHKPTYELDVSDFGSLGNILKRDKFDIVINCVGILNNFAVEHPDEAILLNSYLPHFLVKHGKEAGFKVIHISTDCVFSGNEGSYREDSFKNGVGLYAQSKALGEIEDEVNLTIRTSIIGPELKKNGIGFFNWFMQQSDRVDGYNQAFWSGVTTLQLAKNIIEIINTPLLTGLIHLTNGNRVNKYDLLIMFNTIFNRGVAITPYPDFKVDKSVINTRTDVKFSIPNYLTMISEMKDWMFENKFLYKQYNLE